MCTKDWTTILQAIGQAYPACVDVAQACRSCVDAERSHRAVEHLIERGFVAARPTARGSRSSTELQLTEAGMAVAFGVARIEEDARAAIAARELGLLRELDRLRATRVRALAARDASPAAVAADPRACVPGLVDCVPCRTEAPTGERQTRCSRTPGAAPCKSEPS